VFQGKGSAARSRIEIERMKMDLMVYLAGEIHSDWRKRIIQGAEAAGLPVEFLAPVTDHPASDDVGVDVLGAEEKDFWKDHKGAMINAVRTRTAIERCDVVVVKFGEKYRQWNAAFDAGYAAALGKQLIVIHPPEFTHALKELDAAAQAVAETPEQVVKILEYVTIKD
jgi:YtoQ family protein